ncbi:alpha/beta hydrolase [Dietzia lutea]|uniref:Proteinase n=1 Tax=Dietzia lutea TaxID=546160 RepID=A0A2S1R9A1_9ACTN|nr:alpha/beta hydrolase [Dietzia lutea]AWH92824.1 proteinase [Dietzia lutea]
MHSRRSAFRPSAARHVAAAVASVLVAAGLVVVQGAATTAPAAHAAPTWGTCPDTVSTPGAVCTTVTVPQDYSRPDGETIDVTVSKLPARDPDARRGVLFGNAGGPGGDSLTYFDDNELFTWPDALRDEWDLIGVQPRGLAHAGPLQCAPLNPADVLMLATNVGGAHRAVCESVSGDDWRHLTTENTARDWEQVRLSLGEEQISIHGLSYGTLLGSTYATLFPQHTDKVVLDSGAHPDWMWNQVLLEQNEPHKRRVHDMFDWIAANDATYGLGDTPLKVYQRWTERVLAEAGTTPTLAPPPARVGDVPAEWQSLAQAWIDGTTLTGPARAQLEGLARQLRNPGAMQSQSITLAATRSLAPQSQGWPMLAAALRDGTPLGVVDPEMPAVPAEALIAVNMQSAILCNENRVAPRPLDYPGFLWTQFVTGDIFDATGLMFSSGAACAGAPAVATPVEVSGDALEVPPLLINSVADPQTPLHGARALADRMGAHMVTVDGGDHGQVAKGNTVVDDAVVEYLRTGHTALTSAPAPPPPVAR